MWDNRLKNANKMQLEMENAESLSHPRKKKNTFGENTKSHTSTHTCELTRELEFTMITL